MRIEFLTASRPTTLDEVSNYASDNFMKIGRSFNKLAERQDILKKDTNWMAAEITKQRKTIKGLKSKLAIVTVLGLAYIVINETRMTEMRNKKVQDDKKDLQLDNLEDQLYEVQDRLRVLEIFNNGEKSNDKER